MRSVCSFSLRPALANRELRDLAHVDLGDGAVPDDLVGGFFRNDAQPSLNAGKCGFDVQILLRPVFVGPDFAHRPGAEDVTEDAGIDDRGWHLALAMLLGTGR